MVISFNQHLPIRMTFECCRRICEEAQSPCCTLLTTAQNPLYKSLARGASVLALTYYQSKTCSMMKEETDPPTRRGDSPPFGWPQKSW